MGIRLSKAIRELNIGLQTAVDFLTKRKDLGEVKADPNFKLNDEQYQALVDSHKTDKDLRTLASTIFPKRKEKKEEKRPENHQAEALLSAGRQQFKQVGKIDLDNLGKKPSEKKPEPADLPKEEKPQEKVVVENIIEEKVEPQVIETPKPIVETPVKDTEEKKAVVEKPAKMEEEPSQPVMEDKQPAPEKTTPKVEEVVETVKPEEVKNF